MITSLFDVAREKRRPVRFDDLPGTLIDAVLSAEDRRFFDHPGLDFFRVLGAAWVDLRRGEKAQGASTITMQVARSFFFTSRREWGRKLRETVMALLLEQRFTKRRIFELYANQVYLGNRASFAIRGFGEAAMAYFGKDVRQLDLAESAFLAGIIRAPNRYSSAERRPERAAEARDRVLARMVENGKLGPADAEAARMAPLRIVTSATVGNSAGYFVDLVKDDLLDRYSENELVSEGSRIYTTFDYDLQRVAAQAVEWGMKKIDGQLARKYESWRRQGGDVPAAQVALVVLDPSTGEVRALIGGRDYARSQFDHALAKRQPGSVFKPFVYAAALENAIDGVGPVFTPASTVVDEPTTFNFQGTAYAPDNYGHDFRGTVGLRDALTIAERRHREGGRGCRIQARGRGGPAARARPGPAAHAGRGARCLRDDAARGCVGLHRVRQCRYTLRAGSSQRDRTERRGMRAGRSAPEPGARRPSGLPGHPASWRMSSTAHRGRGAPGVSGPPLQARPRSSHDSWLRVHVESSVRRRGSAFDDNRELGLAGSLPPRRIGAEFMRRRRQLPLPQPQPFAPGRRRVRDHRPGVAATGDLALSAASRKVFIAGTEPTDTCPLHGSWKHPPTPGSPAFRFTARRCRAGAETVRDETPQRDAPRRKKRKEGGFFKRLFGIGNEPGRPRARLQTGGSGQARRMDTEIAAARR